MSNFKIGLQGSVLKIVLKSLKNFNAAHFIVYVFLYFLYNLGLWDDPKITYHNLDDIPWYLTPSYTLTPLSNAEF